MNIKNLFIGSLTLTIAGQLAKFGNENYDLLKEEHGLMLPILCLIGAICLGTYGVRSLMRSFSK